MTINTIELVIDGKVQGTSQFPSGFPVNFYPLSFSVIAKSIINKSNSPTISIGTNSPNYDNILESTDLDGISTTGDDINFGLYSPNVMHAISNLSSVYVNVTAAANADEFLLALELRGEYRVV